MNNLAICILVIPDKKLTASESYNSLLSPFLQWLTSKEAYLFSWKLEVPAKGVMHYHISLPHKVDPKEIREKWTELLTKKGFNSMGDIMDYKIKKPRQCQ